MAIRKLVTLESGIDVDYWRIVAVNANLVRGRAQVELLAWRNAAARNSGKQPLFDTQKVIDLPITPSADLRLSGIYAALMTQQVEREPARTVIDPGPLQPVTIPAVTEPGFFFGADEI